jgi:hypothetical protein
LLTTADREPTQMTTTLGCHLALQKLSLKLKFATGNKHFCVTIPTLIPHNGSNWRYIPNTYVQKRLDYGGGDCKECCVVLSEVVQV